MSIGSGSSFSVNMYLSTSNKNANDLFFAGKTKNLSDGTNTKTFSSEVGFVMKAITTNQDETCFSFNSGYTLSFPTSLSESFYSINLSISSETISLTNASLFTLPTSSYKNLDSKSTNSTAH